MRGLRYLSLSQRKSLIEARPGGTLCWNIAEYEVRHRMKGRLIIKLSMPRVCLYGRSVSHSRRGRGSVCSVDAAV
jgi:hypothetical protein